MNTNSAILRDTSSELSKVSQNQIQWGDTAIANANDSIGWANGETPVAQFIAQGGAAPEAFPSQNIQQLLTDFGIPTFNGPTLFPQAGQAPGAASGAGHDADATYDCATGTCSDGKPPNFTDAVGKWYACHVNPAGPNVQMCGNGPNVNAPNPSDGPGTLGNIPNPLGGLLGLPEIDTKSYAIIFAGLLVLGFGLYAVLKG